MYPKGTLNYQTLHTKTKTQNFIQNDCVDTQLIYSCTALLHVCAFAHGQGGGGLHVQAVQQGTREVGPWHNDEADMSPQRRPVFHTLERLDWGAIKTMIFMQIIQETQGRHLFTKHIDNNVRFNTGPPS